MYICGLAFPQADWSNVIPTWEQGYGRTILFGTIPGTARWNELAWLAMIILFIINKQKIKKAIYGGILFVNIFWMILLTLIVAIFGPTLLRITLFPAYSLVEMIQVGGFLDRVESIVLGLWVFGVFLKLSIFYYVAVLGSAQWFGLEEKKSLILPIGLVIFILSMLLFSNIDELKSFGKTLVFYDLTMVFIIPLIMLMIHFMKKSFGFNN